MNLIRKHRKRRSIINNLMRIMLPILLLLIVLMCMLFYSNYSARELAYRYMKNTTNLYVKQVREDITMINVELVTGLSKDKNVSSLPEQISPNQSKYYNLISNIKDIIKNLRIRYENKYSFYIYNKKADFLFLDSKVYFSSSEKDEFSIKLERKLKQSLSPGYDKTEWSYIKTDDSSYLISLFEDKEKVVGCIINLDNLFVSFNTNNLGYQGIPYYVTEDGTILSTSDYKDNSHFSDMINKVGDKSSLFNGNIIYTFSLGSAGNIKMMISPSNGALEKILFLQIAIIIIFIIILAVIIAVGYYYYQSILTPMKQFVEKLYNSDEEQMLNDTDSFNILELEMASSRFRKLSREIKSLKFAVYEKELNQKKTELEYMQEQIKPHFYLNCLSIIHSMAEMINADNIVHIVETLSNYMRYVIKNLYELRELKDEIDHVKNYAEIQKLRYGDAFKFEIIMDENLGFYYIPPLILQTFVENSFKHAVSLDKHIDITLYIVTENYQGEDQLYICLSDTGKGFPENVLEEIQDNIKIIYDGREHIGIQNAIKRLNIIYGDKAEIKLSNMENNYGAVVEIRIPAKSKRE